MDDLRGRETADLERELEHLSLDYQEAQALHVAADDWSQRNRQQRMDRLYAEIRQRGRL